MGKHKKKRIVTNRLDHNAPRACIDCGLVQKICEFPLNNIQLGRKYYKRRCKFCLYRYQEAKAGKVRKPKVGGPVNFNQMLAAFRPMKENDDA